MEDFNSLSLEDQQHLHLIDVLAGKANKPYIDGNRLAFRHMTFNEWAARKRVLPALKDELRARLFKDK